MNLGDKQRLFEELIHEWKGWVYDQGIYKLTSGDAYRDHRVHGKPGEKKGYSRSWSCHKWRLAKDYNLFLLNENTGRWVYQTTTKAHKPLGLKWESLHDLCAWGGWFNDGNHYSFKHQGHR